jgi:predicted Fe-S protein YdhL (DUF1289 family)
MKKLKKERQSKVKSPCTKRCSLNRDQICPECYRSIGEIVSWPDADDLTRREILEAARLRRVGDRK